MARQDITDREEGGKVEKLPQEGYWVLTSGKNIALYDKEYLLTAIDKIVEYLYPEWLSFATQKKEEMNLDNNPEEIIKNALITYNKHFCREIMMKDIDMFRSKVLNLISLDIRLLDYKLKAQNKDALFEEIKILEKLRILPKDEPVTFTPEEFHMILSHITDVDTLKFLVERTFFKEGGQA